MFTLFGTNILGFTIELAGLLLLLFTLGRCICIVVLLVVVDLLYLAIVWRKSSWEGTLDGSEEKNFDATIVGTC